MVWAISDTRGLKTRIIPHATPIAGAAETATKKAVQDRTEALTQPPPRRRVMDASHVATGTITALLATALVYLSKWPLEQLDLATASAFAGLLVAGGGGLVKLYKSR